MNTVRATLLLCVIALSHVAAMSDLPLWARGGIAQMRRESAKTMKTMDMDDPVVTTMWLNQTINHFASSPKDNPGFFQQKYMYSDFRETADGPVFIYISGEGPMDHFVSGYPLYVARAFRGLLIALEHRYYGESMPFPILTTENLEFLSVEQALKDIEALKDFVTINHFVNPASKWVSVGGSYAGGLSAWLRVYLPDVVDVAWSSSGVVNAVLNFTKFDLQVSASAEWQCAEALRASTVAIVNNLHSGAKDLFSASSLSDPDFLYMVADSGAMAIQYNHKEDLCSTLIPAYQNGEAMDKVFADFTNSYWGPQFGASCFYDTNCFADPKEHSMARQWRWQKCSQLAYLQVAPPHGSIRSHMVNYTALIQQCHDAFGPKVYPQSESFNKKFGGAYPNGGYTIFVDASDDPWQQASVYTSLSETEPYLFIECDGCGHCIDLHATSLDDPEALTVC